MKLMIEVQKTIPFYPSIAKALGGIPEAIYFQHLYYWSSRGKRKDGFIYKTKQEIEEATTIKVKMQDRIRRKLESLGIVETKILRACGSPTVHYRINIEICQSLINNDGEEILVDDNPNDRGMPY